MTPNPSSLPRRTQVGPSLQASKWQKCPVLLDVDEMHALIHALTPFFMVQISGVVTEGEEIIHPEQFLRVYENYIASLKKGEIPSDERISSFFSTIWTTTLEALYTICVKPERCLVKVEQPIVQLQHHRFDYSKVDGKFRSMVLGIDSIQWGIQFSFPHLFQDSELQVFTVREGPQFPNASLFKQIQNWMRIHSIPTCFEVEGKQINVPIRLGKSCKQWINAHPQLGLKGLRVVV